jgi:periplasmic divalent cation tolerance protein
MDTYHPHIVVQVTAGSNEEAWTIARTVVERKLAACAQVVPIRSIYRWRGAVEESDEVILFIKTRRDRYDALEACIKELHSYEVPEILALSVVAGSRDYLEWIDEVIASEDAEPGCA